MNNRAHHKLQTKQASSEVAKAIEKIKSLGRSLGRKVKEMTEEKSGDGGDFWDLFRGRFPTNLDTSGRRAPIRNNSDDSSTSENNRAKQHVKEDDDEGSSMPSLVDQNGSSSSDEAEDDSDSSSDSSMPLLEHGSRSSSSSDIDDSKSLPVAVGTGSIRACLAEGRKKQQTTSSKAALADHTNTSPLQQTRYEIKPPTQKDPKLYVVRCTWCDCKMTENWRRSFLNVKRDKVYGTSTLCPGCVQSLEIIQELYIECKFCKLPPPHLGEASGGGFICEDCSIMRGLLPFKRKTTFKTRSLQKGHPIGTLVHLVRMNVGGGGFEEVTEGNRGLVVGWRTPFHEVWIEGNAPTEHSIVPIHSLRVIQHNNATSEEEAVLLPKGDFSTDQNNNELRSRSQTKSFVDLMQMDCSTIFPSILPVFETLQLNENLPMSKYFEEMRFFFENASNKDIKYCSIVRVLNAWIKLLDIVVGVDVSLNMKPKKGDMKIFDSLVFMVLSSKPTINFIVDFLVRTPYIGHRGTSMDNFRKRNASSNTVTLTPDQSHKCYIASMLLGPLRFLYVVSQLEQYSIFWKCLGGLPRIHLVIERLGEIVRREALGELDGVLLGPYARPPLQELLCSSLENPIPMSIAEIVLAIPLFQKYRTPYDEYFGECPPWDSDSEDSCPDNFP